MGRESAGRPASPATDTDENLHQAHEGELANFVDVGERAQQQDANQRQRQQQRTREQRRASSAASTWRRCQIRYAEIGMMRKQCEKVGDTHQTRMAAAMIPPIEDAQQRDQSAQRNKMRDPDRPRLVLASYNRARGSSVWVI